jgi:hypothetical protein
VQLALPKKKKPRNLAGLGREVADKLGAVPSVSSIHHSVLSSYREWGTSSSRSRPAFRGGVAPPRASRDKGAPAPRAAVARAQWPLPRERPRDRLPAQRRTVNAPGRRAVCSHGWMTGLGIRLGVPYLRVMAPQGICKIKDGWVHQDSVWVLYPDGERIEIPANRYMEQGYLPPIEALPACKGEQHA